MAQEVDEKKAHYILEALKVRDISTKETKDGGFVMIEVDSITGANRESLKKDLMVAVGVNRDTKTNIVTM